MRWAFSDESRRNRRLVVASAIVETHDVAAVRSELRGFLRPNQRRVHLAKESPARRRQFTALVGDLPIHALALVTGLGGRTMPRAREPVMACMTEELIRRGVESWIIETIGHVQEGRDRQAIAGRVATLGHRSEFVYDQRPPHSEPLLWAADAFAWLALDRRQHGIEMIEVR
jgi:hypothetical protein